MPEVVVSARGGGVMQVVKYVTDKDDLGEALSWPRAATLHGSLHCAAAAKVV